MMKILKWIVIFLLIGLIISTFTNAYRELTVRYNTNLLEMYTMFDPSVVVANVMVIGSYKEMIVLVSKSKDSMDFNSVTSSPNYPKQVCEYQSKYNIQIGLSRVSVIIYRNNSLVPIAVSDCDLQKPDAVSSASSKK